MHSSRTAGQQEARRESEGQDRLTRMNVSEKANRTAQATPRNADHKMQHDAEQAVSRALHDHEMQQAVEWQLANRDSNGQGPITQMKIPGRAQLDKPEKETSD